MKKDHKIDDLWLMKDDQGYWRIGYQIISDDRKSPFFFVDYPQYVYYGTIMLFRFLTKANVCGMYYHMNESSAVRYRDLGEEEKPTYKQLFYEAFPQARKHVQSGTPPFEACHVWPDADFDCENDCDKCWNQESE